MCKNFAAIGCCLRQEQSKSSCFRLSGPVLLVTLVNNSYNYLFIIVIVVIVKN